MPNKPTHLSALDGVRGLAILLVLFHHCTVIIPHSPFEKWLVQLSVLGAHGVDLFFVLSGFLITGILLYTKGQPGFFKNFYIRRILRISPLYYALVFFSFAVVPFVLRLHPLGAAKLARFSTVAHDWPWYVFYCSNILIAIKEKFSHGILDVTWSLAIEELFYLIWPVVVAFIDKAHLKKIMMSVILLTLILRIVLWEMHFSWIQIYVLTFTRIDALAFGCLLALFYEPQSSYRKHDIMFLAVIGVVLSLFFVNGFFVRESFAMNIIYSLVGLFFFKFIKIILDAPQGGFLNRIFTTKFLVTFGRYSYAIYLFHLPVRAIIRDLWFGNIQFRSFFGGPVAGQLFFYFLAASAAFACAWISWNVLEKHCLSLKRYFE